eukprot:jgi/Botrbrau1/6609/Bobra.0189s0036.1
MERTGMLGVQGAQWQCTGLSMSRLLSIAPGDPLWFNNESRHLNWPSDAYGPVEIKGRVGRQHWILSPIS